MNKDRFHLRSAVYLMLIKNGQTLLIQRANSGWMDGFYDFPAGHIDGNETAFEAMIREAEEELGITVSQDQLTPATVMHRKSPVSEYIDFYFVAKNWHGEPTICEPEKCSDLQWFPLDQLPDNIVPYSQEALNNYLEHIPFAIFGWE